METLFLLTEKIINGFNAGTLDILSAIAILCGILVIISKNPIVSVLFLIGLFLSIASFLSILSLNFIGISYLLVYVGAVSILFLFILMLINVRVSELLSNTSNSIPLAVMISILFYYTIREILPYSIYSTKTINSSSNYNNIWDIYNNNYLIKLFKLSDTGADKREVYFATSSIWDGNLSETSHITSIGNIMYTSYSIWLILTSIILLLAMVGAIVITINQKN